VKGGLAYRNATEVQVWLNISGIVSRRAFYKDTRRDRFVPSLTAVVELEGKGEVKRIKWDTGCGECPKSDCIRGICGIQYDDYSDAKTCKRDICDIKVIILW
jgi:hypothetical protein